MRRASLTIKSGGFCGNRFEISRPEVLIGRTPTSDLTLVDDGISREHAMIVWEDDRFSIEDLQSTNGTRVNGKPVRSVELADGDEIQIGNTLFVLEIEG
ncbi:MAG: FHA domain-containing protein [Myxococcota bacterium]